MKWINHFFLKLDAVFLWLQLFSVLFSVWLSAGFVAWYLPFSTNWTSYIERQPFFYLLIGGCIHLFTLISHQQVLYIRDHPTDLHTNLTFSSFFRRAGLFFIWSLPNYLLFIAIVLYRIKILQYCRNSHISDLSVKYLAGIFILIVSAVLTSVYRIGISFLYRNQSKLRPFFLFKVWIDSVKSFSSHLTLWLLTYSIMIGVSLILFLVLWLFWTIYCFFLPSLNWNFIYPKYWLSGFFLVCAGLESFFYPLLSIGSSESS